MAGVYAWISEISWRPVSASGGDSGNGGYSYSFGYRSEIGVLMLFQVKQITDGAANINSLQKGVFHLDERQ